MPCKRAAKETNARNGNMIRVRIAVSMGSEPNSLTIIGARAIPIATTIVTQMLKIVRLAERNSRVSLSFWA